MPSVANVSPTPVELAASSGTPWQLARQIRHPNDPESVWLQEMEEVMQANYPDGKFRGTILATPMQGDYLMWALAPAECRDPHEAAWVGLNQLDPAELVPDKKQFSLVGIPSEAAFGIVKLPAHRTKVTLPDELLPLATRTTFTSDEARELEKQVRVLRRD